jgi:hypothetical protein
MKKKLTYALVAFLSVTNFCFGQEKIEKYCEVTIREIFPQKVWINFGNPNTYFKDSTEKKNLLAVGNFKNAIDVLDYMHKLGWDLATSLFVPYNSKKIFYFKKIFDKSEFTIDSNN